jgi:penicillin-binding protein 2
MAQVAAQVANGGIRYKPQFVKYVEGLDGSVTKSYPPIIENRFRINPDALADVKDAMADVVNGAGGTAHKAHLDDVVVCGKTGTAQVVGDNKAPSGDSEEEDKNTPDKYKDHAWFIAFAPKDHPTIAAACIIEHGGHGGSASAPVIHDVFQRYFQLNPPPPTPAIARVLDSSP